MFSTKGCIAIMFFAGHVANGRGTDDMAHIQHVNVCGCGVRLGSPVCLLVTLP